MAAAAQTAEQQALIALQAEMAQTRAQLAVVSTHFDQMAAAHTALQTAHDQLRTDSSRHRLPCNSSDPTSHLPSYATDTTPIRGCLSFALALGSRSSPRLPIYSQRSGTFDL